MFASFFAARQVFSVHAPSIVQLGGATFNL
jgi:hypothetical protein